MPTFFTDGGGSGAEAGAVPGSHSDFGQAFTAGASAPVEKRLLSIHQMTHLPLAESHADAERLVAPPATTVESRLSALERQMEKLNRQMESFNRHVFDQPFSTGAEATAVKLWPNPRE